MGTYAIAPLGVPAMLWSLKTLVGLAGLGCVALVWKGARLQGRDPLAPALLVGLNPVWLVLTVGGAHNDLLMELFAVGGIVVWLTGRQAGGAATVVVGLATKISAAVVLPFMVLGSDRRLRVLIAAGATALALFALWLGVFGTGALRGFGGAIGQQQQLFSQRSIPQQLGVLFDLGARPAGDPLPAHGAPDRLGAVAAVPHLEGRELDRLRRVGDVRRAGHDRLAAAVVRVLAAAAGGAGRGPAAAHRRADRDAVPDLGAYAGDPRRLTPCSCRTLTQSIGHLRDLL